MADELQIYGDSARQAISSLKGYAYQIYESALAWVTLAEGEFLFLEVAEDYAIATNDALKAVQVKAASTAITLNSKEVIETINSFFELSKANSGKCISIKHLTTASIGLERKKSDRINSKSGLEYWISAQVGADIEPLRKRLLELDLSKDAINFLENSSPQQIKEGLIKRIEWLSGAKDIETLRRALSNHLVYLGEKKSVASSLCDAMVGPLISKILSLASSEGMRRLEKADFIRFFDDASRVSLPVSAIETMMSAINPALGSSSHGFVSTVAVLRPVAPVVPEKFAVRSKLVEAIQQAIAQQGFVWLYGAAGTGKSSLSKLIAHEAVTGWQSLQLRSMNAREMAEALYRAASQIGIEKPAGVVLDDLGSLTGSLSKEAFLTLIETARKTSTGVVVTSNLEPSPSVRSALGVTADAEVKIGNLTEKEVIAFVLAKGGNADLWAHYVFLATGGGHPLLVDAMVRGLQAQEWSVEELQEFRAVLGNNRDIEDVKSEVRQRLFEELHQAESNLLVRLSLVLGTFDRKIAMFLADLDPEIEMPGKAFENLIGAWIEPESEDRFRLSSLVSNVGSRTLGLKASEKLNYSLADYYTKDWKLDAGRFEDMVLHGMVGKNEQALTVASLAVFSAKIEDLELIAGYNTNIVSFRTDHPLYTENLQVSLLLRIAQILLLIPNKKRKKFNDAVAAFKRESVNLDRGDENYLTFSMMHSKAMSLSGLVDVVDDLPQFALIAADNSKKIDSTNTIDELTVVEPISSFDEYLQFMFAFQLTQISNAETLQRVMRDLIAKTKAQREFLLKAFETKYFDKSLVIKSSWVKSVSESETFSEQYAEDYAVLARELSEVGENEFAMAAFESSAIIWDEYLKKPEKAIACLEEAKKILGETQAAARAQSRVFFRQGDYNRQLEVGMPLYESFDRSSTEASFFFRELAIGNSHIGRHQVAEELYKKAYNSITGDQSKGAIPMAGGLLADAAIEAHWGGDNVEAINLFSRALDVADKLDPDDGLQSAAVIRLISHSVMWLLLQIKGEQLAADEHAMVPGVNSNPTPHNGLEGPMELPLDYVWYVLAEVEADVDSDCGVIDRVLSKGWDARAVLTSETALFVSLASSAERRLSPSDYLLYMPRAIDARVFAERNASLFGNKGLSSAPRRRLPQLKAEKFAEQSSRFSKQVWALVLRLAFLKSPAEATEFVCEMQSLQRPLITKVMLDAFLKGEPSAENNEIALAGAIGCIVKLIEQNQHLPVTDLMVVCLRLIELMENEFFENSTVPKVKNWVLGQWKVAAIETAFQLTSPRLVQQSLEEFEKQSGDRLSDIADLLLRLIPFVRVNIDQTYKNWLVEIKRRK